MNRDNFDSDVSKHLYHFHNFVHTIGCFDNHVLDNNVILAIFMHHYQNMNFDQTQQPNLKIEELKQKWHIESN